MKIKYFLYPTGNGGAIFQNSYIDSELRGNLHLIHLRSVNEPDLSSRLYLQGNNTTRDLRFVTTSKLSLYELGFETIDKINNGEINV